MVIIVNGEPQNFEAQEVTIADLLRACNVETPAMVSVQVNGLFIDKANFPSTLVKDNDSIDFLYFMGGGKL